MMNFDKVREGVAPIDAWSYDHRSGNGELSDREQQQRVDAVVRSMEKYS
jgi:hypothetical protein